LRAEEELRSKGEKREKGEKMIKKEENAALGKIEKLIVDGNKEVMDRLEGKLDETTQELRREIKAVETGLGQRIDSLDKKIDRLDKKVETNTGALYDLLRDVQGDVKRVDGKLDEHLKVLHGVC
jgi:uncharacterized protein YfbU (UPF0304 family)